MSEYQNIRTGIRILPHFCLLICILRSLQNLKLDKDCPFLLVSFLIHHLDNSLIRICSAAYAPCRRKLDKKRTFIGNCCLISFLLLQLQRRIRQGLHEIEHSFPNIHFLYSGLPDKKLSFNCLFTYYMLILHYL